MSMAQLLTTVRDHLRTQLVLNKDQCAIVLPDSVIPPRAGQLFVAIMDSGVQNQSQELRLLERYFITIAILRRAGEYPLDRRGDLLERETTAIKSLEEMERGCIKHLHMNYVLMVTYNTNLGAPSDSIGDKAVKPLEYQRRTPTQTYLSPAETEAAIANPWLRRDLVFAGMDRHMLQESMG